MRPREEILDKLKEILHAKSLAFKDSDRRELAVCSEQERVLVWVLSDDPDVKKAQEDAALPTLADGLQKQR
jgi:hypothetical protein